MDILYDDNENVIELRELRNDTHDVANGMVGTGSTTTSVVSSHLLPPPGAANEFNGRSVVFDDNTATALLRGRHSAISAQTLAGVLTVATLVAAPASGDLFKVIDYLNAATVAVTVKDSAGNNITGETWPKTMTYVSGSKGRYLATLSDAIAITPGNNYTAIITVESAGLTGRFERPLLAATRTE